MLLPPRVALAIVSTFLWTSPIMVIARSIVAFDFGWKHRTGLKEWAQPEDLPPVNPDPGVSPGEASLGYDTSDWLDVQLPHDGLIASSPSYKACPDGCSGQSFIPRHVLWYRKTFTLPTEWASSAVWLDFQGSFRNTTVWVNGKIATNHVCGYTPFRLRLDNITSVEYGSPTELAIFVDPDNGDYGGRTHASGWWYEGGGLYRHVHLVRANLVHVEQDGLFAYSNISFAADDGITATTATVHTRVSVMNGGILNKNVCVSFQLSDPDGLLVASTWPMELNVRASTSATVNGEMHVSLPKLWSASDPALYTVSTEIDDCNGESLDSVSVVHGFRHLKYDANEGFFLNQEHFKIRGFCDHDNFAVVGCAVPDRIDLFRAQASRAVGGNGRRTSHNPPNPVLLDIYDRLGMVVMDENRLFDDNPSYVDNMGTLVKRDRNHPSVIIWSFCNEDDCEGDHEKGGPAFQAISQEFDGTRPTLANMFTFGDLLSNTVDVQGFSHQSRKQLDDCHAQLPQKPIFMSECCSCNTMRDEDIGCETLHDNPHNICNQTSFNARCAESLVNASHGVNYAVGTMVWTLFDYYGEPPIGVWNHQLQQVSSTYGQYDLCGFPKAAAFWFRTQWLLHIPDGQKDKTFLTNDAYEVHIVESWESPDSWEATKGNTTRTIHAYSNAPFIELMVNGKSQGSKTVFPMVKGPGSYAEWTEVPWEAGKLTAVAYTTKSTPVATMNRYTNSKAAKLALSLDCPSKTTGTGEALLLDGQDAALVRASVLDSAGRVMHLATNNITFQVISGPGIVQGTGNGDPHCHEPNNAPWHSAYHGLVR